MAEGDIPRADEPSLMQVVIATRAEAERQRAWVMLLEAAAKRRDGRVREGEAGADFDKSIRDTIAAAVKNRALVDPPEGDWFRPTTRPSASVWGILKAHRLIRESKAEGRAAAEAIGIATQGFDILRAWKRVAGESGVGVIVQQHELPESCTANAAGDI